VMVTGENGEVACRSIWATAALGSTTILASDPSRRCGTHAGTAEERRSWALALVLELAG
jgi:hypothetical protein